MLRSMTSDSIFDENLHISHSKTFFLKPDFALDAERDTVGDRITAMLVTITA